MAFTGLNANTPKKLLLDAGAFFKGYDLTKSYTENAASLIGATQGGGSFSAVPTIRKIEVDGSKGNVKGMENIDEWVVTMVANCKEVTVDNLKLALGAASSGAATDPSEGYTKITGKTEIEDEDYLENLTWVGRLSGNKTEPVIIVIKNALSLNGLTLTVADKGEAVIPVTVTGHYELTDLETPPFEIYYPEVK